MSTRTVEEGIMKVMFMPPTNDENRYLASLSKELEHHGDTVIEYSWNTLLPLLGPARTGNPDVIHIHWLNILTIGPTWPRTLLKGLRTPIELVIARLLGITVVWTVHNLTAHDREYPRWDLFWRIFVARWCCDHLIVHCGAAKEAVRDRYHLGSATPITVVPHGHYVNEYPSGVSKPDARQRLHLDTRAVVFTFFGQIRPYKRVPYLLDVFKKLDHEEARLVIAGNPKEITLRQRLVDKCEDRDDVVTRLEFIPDEQVGQYFEASDVVVLPYRDILTSGTAILAMSFARPVIAPKVGCLPDLVTDGVNGFLYDPDETRCLERAMERALNADLDAMGANGYETVSRLDWDSIAERTQRVYRAGS